MPKQRARGMSWMVYGVWRNSLLDRLQWPLSSPAFISRSAEQTNQGGGSQAREQQSREPIISPLSPLKTRKHSKHLCVHNRKWSLGDRVKEVVHQGPTEGATKTPENTRKHSNMQTLVRLNGTYKLILSFCSVQGFSFTCFSSAVRLSLLVYALCWSSFSVGGSRWSTSFMNYWMDFLVIRDIHGLQRRNPKDFSEHSTLSLAPPWGWHLVLSEIPWQLLGGQQWHLLQIFSLHRGSTVITPLLYLVSMWASSLLAC